MLPYLTFRRVDEAALSMVTLPFVSPGGVRRLWAMGDHLAIANGVGFIALAGVAAASGVVMRLHLMQALQARRDAGADASAAVVDDATRKGAALRVRPKAMTVAVILARLVPIVRGTGAGSEVMSRAGAPPPVRRAAGACSASAAACGGAC